MASYINPQKKNPENTLLYINGMNTTKEEANHQLKQIVKHLPNIFSQCIYNPTNTNVNSNASKQKIKEFSVDEGIQALIMAATKAERVFLVTYSDGTSKGKKILQRMNSIFNENDPIRKKISMLNFGPDILIPNQQLKIASIQNFIFNKDYISMLALKIDPFEDNKDKSNQNIIWLNGPKMIAQLPASKNPIEHFNRFLQCVQENAIKRYQFKSYFPNLVQAVAHKILLK